MRDFQQPIFVPLAAPTHGVIEMRVRYLALSAATLMLMAATDLSARADDTAPAAPQAPPATTAPPPATSDAPPANVPRPSIVPQSTDKGAEPVAPQTSDDTTPRRHRHYAHRRHLRYAYWEPFPVYWPHIYRGRIYWNRIPWFSF
jgi:hypothetical protein